MPPPPIKCAGAPQKIAYLADDHFRSRGIRDKTRIVYAAGTPVIFSVKEFAKTLDEVIARKGIETMFSHKLVEIRPGERKAVFEQMESGEEVVLDYDMIHITPPQGPPDFVKQQPARERGRLGQRRQAHAPAPRLSERLLARRRLELPDLEDGCGRAQGDARARQQPPRHDARRRQFELQELRRLRGMPAHHRLRQARVRGVRLRPQAAPSFPFDTTKERWSMYQVKRYGLPMLYWNLMTKGR